MGAINYVLRSLEDHIKKILTASLYDSTKHDIAVILVFFTELFDWDLIRGSLLKRFAVFNENDRNIVFSWVVERCVNFFYVVL